MLQAFLQRIRSAENLPSLPSVAVQVLQLARQEDVSLEQFTRVIQNDPAMTAKILKVVNSPLFGMPREIGSLKQAVTLLGLRRLTIMALSFSLVDAIRATDADGRILDGFWRRSMSTAIAARLIARSVAPRLEEEAFVSGLLSDVGIIVAWRCAPDLYGPILEVWTQAGCPIQEVEIQKWGCTHAMIGRELLKVWGLPDMLSEAVGAHHGEGLSELDGESLHMACVMHSAASIAELFCGGVRADQIQQVREQCVMETGIDPARLDGALDELDQHVRQTAGMLSVQVGKTASYAELQAEAAMLMADMSFKAETERDEADRRARQACTEASRLHQERAALLEAASTDCLTGLANRKAFDKQLQADFRQARQRAESLGLIFLDLDHFKDLNDVHGHQAGDHVLRRVGQRLSDLAKDVGFAARYGGEEFVVIIAGKTAESVRAIAETIRKGIEANPVEFDSGRLNITASLGVAFVDVPAVDLTIEQFIEQADQQLYRAKRQGRNRVSIEAVWACSL